MAKLSSKKRRSIPKSSFAVPSKRAYPVHDKKHARAALSMVAKHGSPTEKKAVRAKVAKRYPSIGKTSRHKKGGK